MDTFDIVLLITIGKMLIGIVLLGIVAASLYRFKGFILTVMGLLLLSNLITLALIAGLTS